MYTPQPTPSFDESIKQVIQTLPPPIRNYIAQEKYTTVARGLMSKYNLHIDQGAVVEREIMLLLMGIENPDEFIQALLSQARLDQKTVDNIVRDVNEQIFMPLREEMKRTSAPASAKPGVPQTPRPQPQIQQPRPQTVMSRPPTSGSRIAPLPPKNVLPRAVIQTPSSPKLLEDHEEPHIEIKKPIPPPPKPSFVPPNLPGAIYHPPFPKPPFVPPTPPQPPPPQKPIPPHVSPPAPVKPYSADPYREPIE